MKKLNTFGKAITKIFEVFHWIGAVGMAIALANDALSLAKEKNRIFTATPYTPYEVGDLWVQGTTGDIMRCIRTRLSGSYSSSDWQKASKYTDNTALNNFINGTYSGDIADLTSQIDGKIETCFALTANVQFVAGSVV